MLKLCLITNEFSPSIGGWQTHAFQLANFLSEKAKVHLVAPNYNEADDDFKFDIHRFDRGKKMRNFIFNSKDIIKKILKENDIDLMHSLMVFPSGYVGSLFSLPLVVTAHGNDLLEKGVLQNYMINRCLKKSNKIICVSSFTQSLINNKISNKAIIIPNGVVPEDFSTDKERSRKALNLRHPIILTVSRLVKRKRIDMLIEASVGVIEKFRNAVFVVVGDGEEKNNLITLTKKLKVENNFKFLGFIDDNTLKQYYSAADVFVMTPQQKKRDVEGFGIVFIEALASSTPVIGTNVGGIPDIIDGKNGFIIQNSKELSDNISYLLENKKIAEEMGRYGRKLVEDKFSWKKIADKTLQVYNGVLRTHPR